MNIYNDNYSNYKVGGKCKRKVKTSHGTYRCRGTFSATGECVPCDSGVYPMIAPGGSGPSKGWTLVSGGGRASNRGLKSAPNINQQYGFVGGQQRLIPTAKGGRGQALWFNQAGTPTTADAGMSVSQYVMGLVGVGVLFFVIGYGYKKGVEKA